MTTGDRSRLRLMHDPLEQRVIGWVQEPLEAPAGPVLARAFDSIRSERRPRSWPWDSLLDRLRPEPLGRPKERRAAMLVLASLLIVALAAVAAIGAGLQTRRDVVVPPSREPASSTASRVFPLAGSNVEFVIVASGQVTVVGGDGSGRRRIGEDLPRNIGPIEWIPNTDSVIVQQFSATDEQIWTATTNGSAQSLVLIPCAEPCRSRNEAFPSPQGDRVVFFQALGDVVDGIPTDCGLAIYDMATQLITPVTESPCAIEEERHPRFSPDGRQIAFWRSRSANGERGLEIADSAIFVRDLESGVERQVTDWGDATMLDWSPDGEWIAFIRGWWRTATDEGDLWRVRLDGTGLEQLTSIDTLTRTILWPRYTPDGRWILFLTLREGVQQLWAVPADGGTPVEALPGIRVADYDVRSAVAP